MAKRLCGSSRTIGGIYVETLTSPFGSPLEAFIIDPPIATIVSPGHTTKGQPVMEALNLTPRGVQIREWNGVAHVFDFVGADSYPDVLDYFEETRRLGASRRCELSTSDYAKLTPDSRIILVHPRAMILNHRDFYKWLADITDAPSGRSDCPRRITEHAEEKPKTMCASLWWHDLTIREGDNLTMDNKLILRELPCGRKFTGWARHESLADNHAPAIFLSLPISRLVLVDPKGEHVKKMEKLKGSIVPVEVVDE